MRVTAQFRPPWWVQWISKENETADWKTGIGCRNLRRDPAAHRLSAQEEEPACAVHFVANRVDDRAVALFEDGPAVGAPPSLFRVKKIERDDVEAEVGERVREIDDERAALTRACAVSQDQRGTDAVASAGVEERRYAGAPPNLNGQFSRTFQAPRALRRRFSDCWSPKTRRIESPGSAPACDPLRCSPRPSA